MTTHNRLQMLKKAIASVVNQTYTNWELIVVDDGSKPSAAKIVKAFNDKRILYILKPHTGIYDSTNIGVKLAKGNYISFLDDDDIFLQNKLSQQVEFLNLYKNIDFCFSDFVIARGPIQNEISLITRDDEILLKMFLKSFLATGCYLLKSDVCKKIKFNTKIKESEGVICDWLLRVALTKKLSYCKGKPVCIIKRHSNNITNTTNNASSVIQVLKQYYLLNKKRFSQAEKSRIESNIYFREGKNYVWHHQYKDARQRFYYSILKDHLNINSILFFPFTFLSENVFNIFIPLYEKLTNKIYIKDNS